MFQVELKHSSKQSPKPYESTKPLSLKLHEMNDGSEQPVFNTSMANHSHMNMLDEEDDQRSPINKSDVIDSLVDLKKRQRMIQAQQLSKRTSQNLDKSLLPSIPEKGENTFNQTGLTVNDLDLVE